MMFRKLAKILITGVATATVSCGDKPAAPPPPPPALVSVGIVGTTDASYYDEYPATLVALNQTEIRAQVSGYITGMYFTDGQKVGKGQRLYSIDAQVYNANLQQVQANLQQAQANLQLQETNLAKAQKDADRYHELDKHDAIARQQVDYADAALEAAKKQVASARAGVNSVNASVNSVKANVNFATIYAPFSGTIGISNVKPGTAVVAGQTVLNTVSTDNPIAVDFAVDQKNIYRFIQMQQQGRRAGDTSLSLAFGTQVYPGYGSIYLIDRAVDPQTGTIKTRLQFNNEKGMLKPGMNATVRVLNHSADAVVVPFKAVGEQLGEYFVYTVNDSSKVSQKKILLGKQVGANIIVKDGLKGGEKIVVEGIQKLREGAVITTGKK